MKKFMFLLMFVPAVLFAQDRMEKTVGALSDLYQNSVMSAAGELTFDQARRVIVVGSKEIPMNENTLVNVRKDGKSSLVVLAMQKGQAVTDKTDPSKRNAEFIFRMKDKESARKMALLLKELSSMQKE